LPLIDTPYDDNLNRLRRRIKRPGEQKKAARKFQSTRARQYLSQQRQRPQTPPDYSSQYETDVSKLTRDLSQTQSDIAGRQLATEQQYGFGSDQSNPFSRANELQRQYQQGQAMVTNSYASQGLGYSGAHSRAQAQNRLGFERDMDTSLRQYQGELADYARQNLGAQTEYDEGVSAAEAARLDQGLQDRPEASEAPATPGFVKAFQKKRRQRQRRRKN
jgi:hypothetical protein